MKPTEITLQGGALIVDAPYHPEIVARLKGVGGEWRPASKTWAVAAERGDRLLAALPKASYSYDALCACWKASEGRAAAFAGSLVQWGIKLEIVDSGGLQAICAVGETVSPLIADLVAVYGDALRPWVGVVAAVPTVPAVAEAVPASEEDRKWAVWLTGAQNAAQRAEEEKTRRPRRARRKAARA